MAFPSARVNTTWRCWSPTIEIVFAEGAGISRPRAAIVRLKLRLRWRRTPSLIYGLIHGMANSRQRARLPRHDTAGCHADESPRIETARLGPRVSDAVTAIHAAAPAL